MSTLIIVDMQNDFLLDDGKLSLGHDTSRLRRDVADFAKEFEGEIFCTLDSHKENSCEFTAFPPHCLINSNGWQLVNELQETLNDTSLNKTFELLVKYSFSGSAVRTRFLKKEIVSDEIHIVGVCTHICVHDVVTEIVNYAREVFNCTPKMIIHKNLVDDFNSEMAEMTLKRLQNLYGVQVV